MNFDFNVLLQQMLSFYTIIAVGFLGYTVKLFRDAEVAALSTLTVRLFLPLMLMTSIVNTVQASMLGELPIFFLHLILALGIMLGIGLLSGLLLRLKNPTLGVHTAAVGFPNDGFLGYPLWLAVFPEQAGLAIVAGSIWYATAQWVIAYPLTIPKNSEVKFHWKRILTLPLIAGMIGTALMLVGFHPVNHPVWDTLTNIGGCTKYVAMLYIGAVLAQKGIRRIFSRPPLFVMAGIKMFLGPILVFLLLSFLGLLDRTYLLMVAMMSAMPSPMIICIQSAMNHSDEEYAVGSMVLSTLVCIVSIPLTMSIISTL